MEADKDGDGKLSFEEFAQMVANTVRPRHKPSIPLLGRANHCRQDIVKQMTLEDLF